MTPKQPKDVAASVRQRLLNRARERGEDFQLVLTHYAVERLLYRLSRSAHHERFVLKGAMLFSVWSGVPHRATRDLDLLGYGDSAVAALERVFREICRTTVEEDGLEFPEASLRGEEIRDEQDYQGVRLAFLARLAGARIPIRVDIGFGDTVSPPPETVTYPTLLNFPAPRLLAYSREGVVAEKFQAMVVLGIANSRMRDFFDLWYLAQWFEFVGPRLCGAIQATFSRRKTPVPPHIPLALTAEFHRDRDKQLQWGAFLRRAGLDADRKTLPQVAESLRGFLLPPADALVRSVPFDMIWSPGGPWLPVTSSRP
ncbi:MAG: nucleotidyl transferase AbiEii/AbiGii toxin family protein [candidate division NC10 bacterium]|nr:nucleotidyl transferase AbiEii/AbiGii toxin family protein [candidate division NC10 bacterium]